MNEQWSPRLRYTAFALILLLFAAFLWHVREVLQPLVIAAFIAYLINPLANVLIQRTKMSRPAAVNLVNFTSLALLIATPATLAPIFFDEFQLVVQDVLDLFNQLQVVLSKPVMIVGMRFHLEQLATGVTQFESTVLSPLPEVALRLLETTSRGALWFIVILVSVYYFLAEWPSVRDWLIGLSPEMYQEEIRELYEQVRRVWMNYLRGQITLMIIVGVVFTIAWTIIGIPGALVLGVVAGFFTLIPDVGPFLAAMLAVGVALLEGSNWMPLSNIWVAIIALGVYLVLINIKNLWLRPYIMGRSVHMHEGLVFIAIILATVMWGILGALLIVPVLASVAVISEYLRRRILGLPPFPRHEAGESMPPKPEENIEPTIPPPQTKRKSRREG